MNEIRATFIYLNFVHSLKPRKWLIGLFVRASLVEMSIVPAWNLKRTLIRKLLRKCLLRRPFTFNTFDVNAFIYKAVPNENYYVEQNLSLN